MPNYVDDPENPGKPIDVVKLQARHPLQVLPAFLLPEWMKSDTWSRREALMLLAGYNPHTTVWDETSEGLGMFARERGYLDGLSDRMIQAANVHWFHPRFDEAYKQLLTLSGYATGGSLDERKTPDEWIAWAATKGFSPYWSDLATGIEVGNHSLLAVERDRQRFRAIGHVGGFTVTSSPIINGMATISVGPGEVILTDGKKILYNATSVSISHATPGVKKRVYLHDPLLANSSGIETPGSRALAANCADDALPLGAYEGGLIVVGHVTLVAHAPAPAAASSVDNTSPYKTDNPAPVQAKKRQTAIGREIEEAIARIQNSDMRAIVNQHTVMAELAKCAGTAGSCITGVADGNTGILWRDDQQQSQKLTKEALRKRLGRRTNVQDGHEQTPAGR